MKQRSIPQVLVALLALGALAGCVTTSTPPPNAMAAVAPMLSVERFLQAANTGDLEAMARIFGTSRGSMADQRGTTFSCAFRKMGSWFGLGNRCLTRVESELRMNAIALLLRHDDYLIRSESMVPGRQRPTTRIGVDLQQGNRRTNDIPFLVVQTSDGRWLVEEIDLSRVTSGWPATEGRGVQAE